MSSISSNPSVVSRLRALERNAIKDVIGNPDVSVIRNRTQLTISPAARPPLPGIFPAVITASSLTAGHQARWDYTFTRILIDTNVGAYTTDAETGTALNLAELSHIAEPGAATPWYVWGVDCHNTVIGATLSPRPIGGGGTSGSHKVDQVVDVTRRYTTAGILFYTFSQVGSVEAVCT